MGTLFRDFRYAIRMIIRTPGLSAVAIVTVALGVGLTTHTFSTVYGSVIRGLPFEDGQRLVHISGTLPADGITGRSLPIHDYVDFREQQTVLDDVAAFHWGTVNLADEESAPTRYQGAFVTPNLFSQVVGRPALGRLFTEDEYGPSANRVILLGHHVWQTRYGGDSSVVGQTVRVNGLSTTVVGIMQEGFKFPFAHDAWLPMEIHAEALARGEGGRVDVVGRVKPGVSMEQVGAEFDRIAALLAAEYPETNEGTGVTVSAYEHEIMPPEITAVLYVMLAAVFGVLFIACANVANLLLARATVRSREVAIRSALGASRAAVVRQLLIESLALATVGGVLGTGLAIVGTNVFVAVIADIQKPYWIDIRTDAPILFFAVFVTMLASIVAGLIPALKASGGDTNEVLKDSGRGSSSLRMSRFSTGLVISEIAVSCALLIGAGMMVRSIVQLNNLDMGFEPDNILTARVTLPNADYPDAESRLLFFDDLKMQLASLPGVEAVGLADDLPATGAGQYWFGIDGMVYPTDQDYPFANGSVVSDGFFETFGVEPLSGRLFTAQDRADNLPVIVVNQSFVGRHFPGETAIGRRIRLGRSESEQPWLTVVGVVPDLHVGGGVGGIGSGRRIKEMFYRVHAQTTRQGLTVAMRTSGDPLARTSDLRATVTGIDPNLPIFDVASMDEALEAATWAFGVFGSLFAIFGAIALFMSAVGLYGVMAFSVSSRTQEMGIRMALGASAGAILRMVFGKGFFQLGIGMAVGLGLGALMSRPLQTIMFDAESGDPVVYLTIVLVLVLSGLLACLVPARRAIRVQLVEALKPEG